MKFITSIIVVLHLMVSAYAQHCPYDGASIIVLNIYSEDGKNVIPDLTITLLDTNGNPILQKGDALRFWQNTKEPSVRVGDFNSSNAKEITYWFASNNYVAVVPSTTSPVGPVLIQDGNGRYETTIAYLPKGSMYPLCTEHSGWDEGEAQGFMEGYKPVGIRLFEKK